MDKYQHLIEMGKTLPLISPSEKTDDKLIKGCQSKVWLHAQLTDNEVVFTADSDAVITKGIIAILIRVFSKQPPEAVVKAKTDFIDEIGLKEHLSPTRANGLVSMIKQMKLSPSHLKRNLMNNYFYERYNSRNRYPRTR